jgi:hypothetical protein
MKFHKVHMTGTFVNQEMTTVGRNAATPTSGRAVYDTDQNLLYLGDGTNWNYAGLPGGNILGREELVASAGQTLFTLCNFTYVPANEQILVFTDGLLMDETTDYLETSTTEITFTDGRNANEEVTVIKVNPNFPAADSTLIPFGSFPPPNPLSAADSGKSFTNEGSIATTTFNLPLSLENQGMHLYILKTEPGQDVVIQCTGSDTINDSAPGGILSNVAASEEHSSVHIMAAPGLKWIILGSQGTWVAT